MLANLLDQRLQMAPSRKSVRDPRVILHDAQAHKDCWTRVAGSFADWLDVAARTRGAFGYTRSKTAA
jgi:hypothetical protein